MKNMKKSISTQDMCEKLSKQLFGGKCTTNRVSIKPLTLPNWTKVLRLGAAVKVSIEEIFEVLKSDL